MNHRFDKIAFNSTAKKTPTESDKEHYIGLEHIDSECLEITRWGSNVAPIGEKLIMKKVWQKTSIPKKTCHCAF